MCRKQEELSSACEVSLCSQDPGLESTIEGPTERLAFGVRGKDKSKLKNYPDLEYGYIDRPLGLWFFVLFFFVVFFFKAVCCAQLIWKISYIHSFFIKY